MPVDPCSASVRIRAIEALNQHDIDAALAGDIEAVFSQWTEDFVVLSAVGPIIRGRAANMALAEEGRDRLHAVEPLSYVVDFEEINVVGDFAFEWGTFKGTMRPRGGGDVTSFSGKLMRILHRQPDGSWKMHRTMATNDPPAP